MTKLYDYHVHTLFSGDCRASVESVTEAAKNRGLSGICFTDHMDLDFPGEEDFVLDIPRYLSKTGAIKEAYKHGEDDFLVCAGIELGLQTHLADKNSSIIRENDFDFVIASSHLIDGIDPYDGGAYFEGRSEEEAYRRYFESILENISVFDDFDVYGHLDYIVRYGPNKDKFYSYDRYADVIDPVLIKLISMGKGIELNMGGLKRGMRFPNPCPEIIRRYKSLGGETLTLGSDAHESRDVGCFFDAGVDILRVCGFDRYCIFRNRERFFIDL